MAESTQKKKLLRTASLYSTTRCPSTLHSTTRSARREIKRERESREKHIEGGSSVKKGSLPSPPSFFLPLFPPPSPPYSGHSQQHTHTHRRKKVMPKGGKGRLKNRGYTRLRKLKGLHCDCTMLWPNKACGDGCEKVAWKGRTFQIHGNPMSLRRRTNPHCSLFQKRSCDLRLSQ